MRRTHPQGLGSLQGAHWLHEEQVLQRLRFSPWLQSGITWEAAPTKGSGPTPRRAGPNAWMFTSSLGSKCGQVWKHGPGGVRAPQRRVLPPLAHCSGTVADRQTRNLGRFDSGINAVHAQQGARQNYTRETRNPEQLSPQKPHSGARSR